MNTFAPLRCTGAPYREDRKHIRRKTMLTAASATFSVPVPETLRDCESRTRCQIEDGLDKRPITEAHADAYANLSPGSPTSCSRFRRSPTD